MIKFVGDALMVLFTDAQLEARCADDANQLAGLRETIVTRACQALLKAHAVLHGYQPVPDVTLKLHSAIAYGRMCCVYGSPHISTTSPHHHHPFLQLGLSTSSGWVPHDLYHPSLGMLGAWRIVKGSAGGNSLSKV